MCCFSVCDTFPTDTAGKTVLYLTENTMFSKHSAFCIFVPVLQQILSPTYVKLKEMAERAETRPTADIWMSKVNSHMPFLAPSMTHVESAGRGRPARARGIEMAGLLSTSLCAGFGVV